MTGEVVGREADVVMLLAADLAQAMQGMLLFLAEGTTEAGASPLRGVAALFAKQDLTHAALLAARIVALGGEPQVVAAPLAGQAPAGPAPTVRDAQAHVQQAMAMYRQQLAQIGERDPTTRALCEGILADLARQAAVLAGLSCE